MKLNVNGATIESTAPGATPLIFVLREAGLASVRHGCGAEQCGACRVLIDGEPNYSCTIATEAIGDRQITTLEGLARSDVLSSVQQALLTHNATQCGYCLSGIAITAHALFARNPHPSDVEIAATLDPHLCRCGAQPRVLRALNELART